jgi:peptidyl-prolyl cis-trans isomerase C
LFVKQHHVYLAALLAASVACQKPGASKDGRQANAAAPASAKPAGAAAPQPGIVQPRAESTKPKPVPARLPEVIAKVNDDVIKRTEFELMVQNVERRAGRPVPADQRDQVYRGVLDEMIAMRLLQQEVGRRRLTATDVEMSDAMKQLQSQFPTEAAFKQALDSQHMTLDQLRTEARQQILVSKVLQQEVAAKISVTPTDISNFYEKNPERFQQPETVHASHVLIAVPETADARAKAAARAKAENVLKQARGGADFATLARTYSDDASKARGGDLGFFPKGQMVPAFEAAAFALRPNQVSGIVQTPFGFHVIKVLEKRPPQTVPFAEAAPRIEQYLKQEQQQAKSREFVDQLRAKGHVQIFI